MAESDILKETKAYNEILILADELKIAAETTSKRIKDSQEKNEELINRITESVELKKAETEAFLDDTTKSLRKAQDIQKGLDASLAINDNVLELIKQLQKDNNQLRAELVEIKDSIKVWGRYFNDFNTNIEGAVSSSHNSTTTIIENQPDTLNNLKNRYCRKGEYLVVSEEDLKAERCIVITNFGTSDSLMIKGYSYSYANESVKPFAVSKTKANDTEKLYRYYQGKNKKDIIRKVEDFIKNPNVSNEKKHIKENKKGGTTKRKPFSISNNDLSKYKYANGTYITYIVNQLNEINSNKTIKLKNDDLTNWLVKEGYLTNENWGLTPTPKGKNLGISVGTSGYPFYDRKAERFIIDNLLKILS